MKRNKVDWFIALSVAAVVALLLFGLFAPADAKPRKVSREFVATHAKAAGVPVNLAVATVRVESGFKPHVRGRAGEYGLTQIKCATARGIGFRGKCSGLFDPVTNLRYGFKYLKLALKRAKGNHCRASAYYNAGIHAKRIPKAAWRYCNMVAAAKR